MKNIFELSLTYFITISKFTFSADLPPRVSIPDLGTIEGTLSRTAKGRSFFSFEGIPFARPPVGNLRFEEPQKVEPWNGIWKADKTYKCLQYPHCLFKDKDDFCKVEGQEDCLYLNIYTPNINSTKFDVIVYIHGGAFMFSDGGFYRPDLILDKDIVYVSINYRLGPLGFLSTENDLVPGNNGIKDQIVALEWIQRYISQFSGNPDSVTITGCSAGGASVHIHYLTDKSNNLFHKGILRSGVVLNPWVLTENPLSKTQRLGEIVGCSNTDLNEMLKCLKSRPGEQIVDSVRHFQDFLYNPFTPFGVVVDSWSSNPIFKDHPYNLIKSGRFKDLPTIISYTNFEGLYPGADFVEDKFFKTLQNQWNRILPSILHLNDSVGAESLNTVSEKIRDYYLKNENLSKDNFDKFITLIGDRIFLNDIHKSIDLQFRTMKSPVYFYHFAYRGEYTVWDARIGKDADWFTGAGHYDDTFYVFGMEGLDPTTTESDRKIVDLLADMYANFAKTGNPNIAEKWPQLNSKNKENFIYSLKINSPSDLEVEELVYSKNEFWESLPILENEKLFAARKDEL